MELVNLVQGTPEWHAHRIKFFNASEAPAMLGVSHYKTRAALLRERQTGVFPEVPPAVAARFAEGHRAENLARAFVESEILGGEDLYPVVGTLGKLSASFDGLTLDESIGFEHKITNQRLRDALPIEGENPSDNLPEEYRAQMEQQLLVSGAQKILFMASSWDAKGACLEKRYCWYVSDPAMRQRIMSGWEEFERDLAKPPEEAQQAAAMLPTVRAQDYSEGLPAPLVTLQGEVAVGGNLAAFGESLRAFVAALPPQPQTDDEFVECIAAIKVLKKAEEALDSALADGLCQVESIAQMRRAVADLRMFAAAARRRLETCVCEEKKARRSVLIEGVQREFAACVGALSEKIQATLPGFALNVDEPDFEGAIKGLSSVESIENKLKAALLEGKARAGAVAEQVAANLELMRQADGFQFLFPDKANLLYEETDKLEARIAGRIESYQAVAKAQVDAAVAEAVAKAQVDRVEQGAQPAVAQAPEQGDLISDVSPEKAEDEKVDVETLAPASGAESGPQEQPLSALLQSLSLEAGARLVSLHDINDMLAPFTVTRPFLASMGFEADAMKNRVAHYTTRNFVAICLQLARNIQTTAARFVGDAG